MIPYEMTVELRPTYLHAKVVGERTPENALRFLREVFMACMDSGCRDALLEMCLSGPSLNTTDVYRVISERSPDGAALRRIAYVDVTSEVAQAKFAETVAVNRGVRVRLFATVAEAERWLQAA